jgi:hypothetical protein
MRADRLEPSPETIEPPGRVLRIVQRDPVTGVEVTSRLEHRDGATAVILGIRPSDFEDASLGRADRATMRVTAGVTEELGSEINVIFTGS